MMSIDSPLFRGSQWFDCKNNTGSTILCYSIAEVSGTSIEVVGDQQKPVMIVRPVSSYAPRQTVFIGPASIPAGGFGVCHSGDFGYAAHSKASLQINDELGVTLGSTVLAQDRYGFVAIGDTFSSSGRNVALFHKRQHQFGRIQFTIVSANLSSGTAIVDVTWRPCGVLNVQEEDINGRVTVKDTMGYFDDEVAEDLVGRKGTAWYASNNQSLSCEWIVDGLQCDTDV